MNGTAPRHVALLMAVLASFLPVAQAEVPIPRGYFVLRSAQDDRPVPDVIWRDPSIAGVSLRRSWATVNPSPGLFDFAYLDREIASAARNGKTVMIHVDACGDKLPEWVAQQVETYPYTERNSYAPTAGMVGRAPVPWDEAYLTAWCACVRELGRRYDHHSTVVAIHVGGPTRRGSEVFFPNEVVKLPGYSASRALNAWKRIFTFYEEAFRSTSVVMDLAQPTSDRSLTASVLLDAFIRGVDHPVLQHNSLSAKTSDRYAIHRLLVDAGRRGTPVGFQQLCSSETPRHGGSLNRALQTARQAGARYIEIYEPDRRRLTAAWPK
jgi:hypothetical protein